MKKKRTKPYIRREVSGPMIVGQQIVSPIAVEIISKRFPLIGVIVIPEINQSINAQVIPDNSAWRHEMRKLEVLMDSNFHLES